MPIMNAIEMRLVCKKCTKAMTSSHYNVAVPLENLKVVADTPHTCKDCEIAWDIASIKCHLSRNFGGMD